MIVIKVYGVPDSVNKDVVASMIDPLRFAITSTVRNLSAQGICVFFISDMIQDGLGEELYAEISGLDDLRWSELARNKASENVAQALEIFARANITQCSIICVRPIPINGSLADSSTLYISSK